MKVNNRWFQLVASLIAMIMIANLQYAWTLFVSPMQKSTHWTLPQIQYAFTLFVIFQTWVQPLDGWLMDRMGPRVFITAAGLLCGLGWAGLGTHYMSSVPMLYVLYCLAGIGAAFVYSGCIGSALKWFKERRGLAAGIMAVGFGGGTALFIPFISRSIEAGGADGWRNTFIWTGILQGSVILIVAQFLRHPPVEAASAPVAATQAQLGKRQFTTFEMLRTPQFYTMYAMFVMMATGGLLVTANAGPISKTWGLSAGALALATTLSPIANGASRISWGWISDRIGRETAMTIAFVAQAICLVLVPTIGATSGAMFSLTLVLVYFTWGEIYSLFPSATADYFGTRNATSNYGALYTAKGVASIIGGGFGATMFGWTGSWSPTFYGSALLALIAAGLAYGLRTSRAVKPLTVGSPVTAR